MVQGDPVIVHPFVSVRICISSSKQICFQKEKSVLEGVELISDTGVCNTWMTIKVFLAVIIGVLVFHFAHTGTLKCY